MPEDPARAVLLATEAMQASRPDDGAVGSARQTLRDAIDAAPGYGIGRHDGAVLGLAFALAGSRVVSASADGTVRVWEATTDPARPPLVLRGHKGSVAHLAVDRKGEHIVSGGDDGTVAVWNLTDPDTQASHLALEPPQSGEPQADRRRRHQPGWPIGDRRHRHVRVDLAARRRTARRADRAVARNGSQMAVVLTGRAFRRHVRLFGAPLATRRAAYAGRERDLRRADASSSRDVRRGGTGS